MGVLIPIFGVSIPLVVVIGKFILEPLLAARRLGTGADAQRIAFLEARVQVLEHSLEGVERTMGRLTEENDFLRQLNAPAAQPVAR